MKNHSLIHYFGFNEWYIMHEGPQCMLGRNALRPNRGFKNDGYGRTPPKKRFGVVWSVLRRKILRRYGCSVTGCSAAGCSVAGCSDAPMAAMRKEVKG